MDAPKCKLCQERHYGLCVGKVLAKVRKEIGTRKKSPGASAEPQTLAPAKAPIGAGRGRTVGVIPATGATKKKRAPRGTFDRNAYQRELMRKRRAANKAAL